jgi:tryptophan 2,3-dioxygenase
MEKKDIKYTSIHYKEYLQLDKIVNAQDLRSVEAGKPAHEEMLFIITHQVYELWFKQIIHELRAIIDDFDDGKVDERNIGRSVARLDRVLKIQGLLVEQIEVMETMTALDFLEFRSYLFPASGFQSIQFREIEILLGLKRKTRENYLDAPYDVVFNEKGKDNIKKWEGSENLFTLIEDWLERTPFLNWEDFNFVEKYTEAVTAMFKEEEAAILATNILSDENKKARIENLKHSETYFHQVLSPEKHQEQIEAGTLKLSYKATIAALMINLYREEPILWQPFNLLRKLVEVDQQFTIWRNRHAQMVMRMLGNKMGTGGSSGHKYLKKTAEKHHVFRDFYHIATLLVPRHNMPDLPEDLKKSLSFYFSYK